MDEKAMYNSDKLEFLRITDMYIKRIYLKNVHYFEQVASKGAEYVRG